MHVHLQGMGVSGSLLALRLERDGIPFTWADIDHTSDLGSSWPEGRQAWKASTGLIYPSGVPFEHQNYLDWYGWYFHPVEEAPWGHLPKDQWERWVDVAAFWFIAKNPPHAAHYDVRQMPGSELRLGNAPSFHLNAQLLVMDVRERFASRRISAEDAIESYGTDSTTVITHGFNKRLGRLQWGWTGIVSLNFSREFQDMWPMLRFSHVAKVLRPMLYLREGLYKILYANPVPGTNFYYAGSHLISQQRDHPKSLEVGPKLEAWHTHLQKWCGNHVTLKEVHRTIEGWRPMPALDDRKDMASWEDYHGTQVLVLKPMAGNGARCSPALLKDALAKIQGGRA